MGDEFWTGTVKEPVASSALFRNKKLLNKKLDPRFAKDARPMYSRCIGYHTGTWPLGAKGAPSVGVSAGTPDRPLHILGYVELDLPPVYRLCERFDPAGSKGELPPAYLCHRP